MKTSTPVSLQPRTEMPIRVLIADPDVSLLSTYREPFFRQGFELGTAISGLDCIDRLRECRPDVLVLEPHIPWGGGDGILAIMGESPVLATVPVMILTSGQDPCVLKGVGDFPISDYHLKPLGPDRLVAMLRCLFDYPRFCFTLNDYQGRLECAIARRTGGRVRDLHVQVRDGRVIVHGCSQSHHVKQLVLAAVLETIEASESQDLRIESKIEVCGDCPSTIPEMCFKSTGKRESLRWTGPSEADS